MTPQETFNTVVAHLRKQGCKALDMGDCVYRTVDGLKCAAGCLIPDADYKPEFEGLSISTFNGENIVCDYFKKLEYDINLIKELQEIHDCYDPSFWETRFKALAAKRHLVFEEKS